jgi:hypothetical protein
MSPSDFKANIALSSAEVIAAIAEVMRLVNEGQTSGAAWELASNRQEEAFRRWRRIIDSVQITAATRILRG